MVTSNIRMVKLWILLSHACQGFIHCVLHFERLFFPPRSRYLRCWHLSPVSAPTYLSQRTTELMFPGQTSKFVAIEIPFWCLICMILCISLLPHDWLSVFFLFVLGERGHIELSYSFLTLLMQVCICVHWWQIRSLMCHYWELLSFTSLPSANVSR